MNAADNYLLLLEKRRELAALRLRDELRSANGLASYRPHAKQDAFHRAGRFKSRYARTGNRFGKSTMGAAEDCAWALGERSWYAKDDPARYAGIPKRSVKVLIIVATWAKAHEIFTNQAEGQARGKLFQLLPRDSVVDVRRHHGEVTEIFVQSIHGGVSSITLATVKGYKADKLTGESGDFDAIHVDEPCPEAMFKAFSRGLVDRDGSEWFTCTPLFQMWINDRFNTNGAYLDEFSKPLIQTTKIVEEEQEYEVQTWMITGSMHDNPTFTGQSKARYISNLTEDEKETRISGRPAALTGAVYKEFNPSDIKSGGHVHRMEPPRGWDGFHRPPDDWCIRVALDTHPSNPHAVLLVATGPTGHSVFFGEIYDRPYMQGLVQQIFSKTQGRMPMRSLLELAAYNKSPYEGAKTLAQEIVEAGLHNVEPASKDLSFGIILCQQMLSKRDKDGYPLLSFCPHLVRTFREFERYVWDPDTGKPVDAEDHMMENFYRLNVSDLTYVSPQGFVRAEYKETFHLPMQRAVLPKGVETKLPGGKPKRLPLSSRYPTNAPATGISPGFRHGRNRQIVPYYIDVR